MNSVSKALVGTLAAGSMALAAVTPVQARDRDNGGIGAGEIIAGALIIGAVAAAAGAFDGDDDRNYNRRGNRGYDRVGYSPRSAVEQCVYAAERRANRYSHGGRAKVTDIRDVDRKGNGYRVKGRIAVNQSGRDWRHGDSRYGRGWDNDYRGWNDRYRGYDSGKFTCDIRNGRVVDLDYSGIRGLK